MGGKTDSMRQKFPEVRDDQLRPEGGGLIGKPKAFKEVQGVISTSEGTEIVDSGPGNC